MMKFYVVWMEGYSTTSYSYNSTYLYAEDEKIREKDVEGFREQISELHGVSTDSIIILNWKYIGVWD